MHGKRCGLEHSERFKVDLISSGRLHTIIRWAVGDGQYDDLKGPAYGILMDEDKLVELDVELDEKRRPS